MFQFSGSSLANRHGIDERLIEISDRALEITLIDFGIPKFGGMRTAEEQNQMFKNGKSMLDGYDKKSKHQEGKAIDFFAYVDGQASWEKEHLAQVACAFLQAASEMRIKISWGGLWRSFQDMPHIQLEE